MRKKVDMKAAILMLVGVAVIAGIVVYAVYTQNTNQAQQSKFVPIPNFAMVQGRAIPTDFPKGLVIDAQPGSVAVSEALPPGLTVPSSTEATISGYSLAWNSKDSASSLLVAYKKYFSMSGWKVVGETDATSTGEPVQGISAENPSSTATANFSFHPSGSGSNVMVFYIKQ